MGDPATALRTIAELGRTALGELDGLVVHLRDPAAPLSVSAPPRLLDIDELLAEPLRRQGVAVSVRVEADLGLDDADVLTVYRIAQEALTNVARHASARHVWVDLGRHASELRLRISDDGVGSPTRRAVARACWASRSGWRRAAAAGRSRGAPAAARCSASCCRSADDAGRRRRRPAAGQGGLRADPRRPAGPGGGAPGRGRRTVPRRGARRPAHRRRPRRHPDAGAGRAGRHPRPGGGAARAGRDRGDHVRGRRLRARRDRGGGARLPAQALQRPRSSSTRSGRWPPVARSCPPR